MATEPSSKSARPRPSFLRRAAGAVGALGVLGAVGVLGAAALGAIYAAADAEDVAPTAPLPVAVAELHVVGSYETTQSYVGRIEPARATALGFQNGGEVTAVLVDEGDDVAAGQPIATLDTASLEAGRDQLVAEKSRLEANLALAQRTRARQDQLSGDGYASEQRADEARTEAATTVAQIAAIDAQIRQLDVDIAKATIRAPFAGVVAARSIDPGAIAAQGQTIVEILEAGRPQARIGLPPEQAARLRRDQGYEIVIRGQKVPARLATVRPDLDPATRTVAAIFDLDFAAGAAPLVAPFGEVARLELPLEIAARGAWVPLSALQEDAKGLWRLLLISQSEDGGPVVTAGAVETLYVSGERAFVAGAIADGQHYITEGLNRAVIGDIVAPIAGE